MLFVLLQLVQSFRLAAINPRHQRSKGGDGDSAVYDPDITDVAVLAQVPVRCSSVRVLSIRGGGFVLDLDN